MNASWNLMLFNPEGAPAPEPRGTYMAYSRILSLDIFRALLSRSCKGAIFLKVTEPILHSSVSSAKACAPLLA